ncbi:MAG: hypothetical protein R6V35_04355 [Candidatus Nanohaloarchaea archaeon]
MSKSQQIDPIIRLSRPEEAENITETFIEEYLDYYGMYVNSDLLEEFLNDMNDQLRGAEKPEEIRAGWDRQENPEIVRTVENNDEFLGVGSLKLQDNLLELGSTIIDPEYRNSRTPSDNSVYDELFMNRLETAKDMVSRPEPQSEIIYTQLLADKSAATQHTADKHDFAVTGVYDKKFPQAYEGKGRVTVVDMLWADSLIENDQSEVYVPEEAEDIVELSRENINSKRSEGLERIERTINNSGSDHRDGSYKVKPKVVEDPMNFAEIEIVESEMGNYTWEDVMDEISAAEERLENSGSESNDYWIGLTLDANSDYLPGAATLLEGEGFEYCGFNPGKIDFNGENRDALEMQYRPSKERIEKEFVEEAAEFIRGTGMAAEETASETDYSNSEIIAI